MKIVLIVIGKTAASYLREGIADYEKRLKYYITFEYRELPDVKNVQNLSEEQLKEKEGSLLLKQLGASDELILLDEHGKQFSSKKWAVYLEHKMLHNTKTLVFAIGGAYGFSNAVYKKASDKLSLSSMTFSHQMVRMIFLEQLYRAYTIIKGEPYHHG